MQPEFKRTLSKAEIATYNTDGVLLIRQAFDPEWIEGLSKGLEHNRGNPTHRARRWYKNEAGHSCFGIAKHGKVYLNIKSLCSSHPLPVLLAS